MKFQLDFLFRTGNGYDELVNLIQSNQKYVFYISRQDKIDKRTKKSRESGWVVIRHKQHDGEIKLSKAQGVCRAEIKDLSGGLKLVGAWTSWLASNASDMVSGFDIRIL